MINAKILCYNFLELSYMQALIMSPAGRVFLPLRKDLSRVDESFTSGIGAGDLSGTNNETYTHCTLLAGLRFSKPLTYPQAKKLSYRALIVRDLKQTTAATTTRKWQNKRSNEQNNSAARALSKCVHFLAVLCKMTTWNHQNLRGPRNETSTANYLSFYLELNAVLVCYAEFNLRHCKRC